MTLKSLLMDGAPALLTQLAGTPEVSLAPAEYPAVVTRTVDLVGLMPGQRLLHAEVQSSNGKDMPARMLGYYWMFLEADPAVDVTQVVFYIGADPLRMPDGLTRTGLTLGYRIIDVRTLDPGPLLESDSLADVVASFLCRADNIEERVREILDRLQSRCGSDGEALDRAISHLVLLANLRGAGEIIEKEVRAMPITINIEDNPILLRIYNRLRTESKAEGKAEGKVEAKAEVLLRQMRHRYGALPDTAVARVLAAGPDELDMWTDRVLDAETLDALFAGSNAA